MAGLRQQAIVFALLLSVLAHVGLMVWVRPRVMTSVTRGVATAHRRGPMRVTEAPPQLDPVRLQTVKDLLAMKDAPDVGSSEVLAPAPAEDPLAAGANAAPPACAAPEVVSTLVPEETAPTMVYLPASEAAAPSETLRMELSSGVPGPASAVAAPSAPSVSLPGELRVVPAFEPPSFTPQPVAGESVGKLSAAPEDAPKRAFRPVEEVMPTVDEKVVEAEKAAVRDLLVGSDALDATASFQVTLASAAAGGYTYFKATVAPKVRLPTVEKDVVILIDASGSIGGDRLSSCRKAARRILRTCTNTGDRFNLVAFRDRFSYAFRTWQPCDAPSFEAGDKWLSRLAAHGRTDVFSTIASVLTLPRDPVRPLIALVVTDGDANMGVSDTASILSKFSRLNDGLVSVYMYGVKSSANRALIDVLTRGNRGESFVYDGWRWNAGDGIEALSERFRDPVLTDLRVIFASGCEAESYPAMLRNLYAGNAVEFVGRVKGTPAEIGFSLRGLAGRLAYEGFYRLPLAGSAFDRTLPSRWAEEKAVDAKLR